MRRSYVKCARGEKSKTARVLVGSSCLQHIAAKLHACWSSRLVRTILWQQQLSVNCFCSRYTRTNVIPITGNQRQPGVANPESSRTYWWVWARKKMWFHLIWVNFFSTGCIRFLLPSGLRSTPKISRRGTSRIIQKDSILQPKALPAKHNAVRPSGVLQTGSGEWQGGPRRCVIDARIDITGFLQASEGHLFRQLNIIVRPVICVKCLLSMCQLIFLLHLILLTTFGVF